MYQRTSPFGHQFFCVAQQFKYNCIPFLLVGHLSSKQIFNPTCNYCLCVSVCLCISVLSMRLCACLSFYLRHLSSKQIFNPTCNYCLCVSVCLCISVLSMYLSIFLYVCLCVYMCVSVRMDFQLLVLHTQCTLYYTKYICLRSTELQIVSKNQPTNNLQDVLYFQK